MAGVGTNIFGTLGGSASASTGSDSGPALASATYGPPAAGSAGPLSPRVPHGLGFWLACGGVAALVLIRQSLPR